MNIKILLELPKKIINCGGIILLILLTVIFGCSKDTSESQSNIDTVFIEKLIPLGGTLSSKDEEPVIIKPLPSFTKYKVSDWVCAWNKWSGVVTNIHWSVNDSRILVYVVQHYNEEDKEWYENTYYDSELESGKCN